MRSLLLMPGLLLGACADGDSDDAAATTTTTTTVEGEDDDGATFVDPIAKLEYAIPDGWTGPETEGLLEFFTSVVTSDESSEEEPAAIAGAGLFESTFFDPAGGLEDATAGAVAGFAEFFVPEPGAREVEVNEAVEVSGNEGWHVRFRIVPDDPEAPVAIVEMVGVDLSAPAYVVAIAIGEDPDLEADIGAVIASVRSP